MGTTKEESAEIGRGSRRVCTRIPGTNLCLKRYRDDDGVGATVRREIARGRFDRRLNTCAQEYDYLQELKRILPSDVLSVFPETFELHEDPKMGWHLVESLVLNGDGSVPERFSRTYRGASAAVRPRLYAAFRNLMHAFESAAACFYDPQNVIVQWPGRPYEGEDFLLRIVDFEPASRTLLPIGLSCPSMRRRKLRRRVARYLLEHVGIKYNPLSWREREAWDALVATEGAKLGLTECRAFLENKLVNDVFYEGRFSGKPCIVKCSSRVPESIANEFAMLKSVYSDNPAVFPEPYAFWSSPDGRMAFVVMECVRGGVVAAPAVDIVAMAETLKRTGVVHRDISSENIVCGLDGHLKLIDFQFAIDRNDYRETRFMLSNPKYRFVNFGNCESLGLGVWNDFLGLGLLECLRRFAPDDAEARGRLSDMVGEMTFWAPVSSGVRLKMLLYMLSLKIQNFFVKRDTIKWRLYKMTKLMGGRGAVSSLPADTVSFSFCISDNYAQHLAVVIASLLCHNPSVRFVFHVLHRDIRPETEEKLRELEKMYPNHEIVFHRVDSSSFDRFPVPKTLSHITQEAYYRYILPQVLPDEGRTIYSDVDVLCVGGDIRELWNMDLAGSPMAAIRKNSGNDAHYVAHMERMGVPAGSKYFFDGMLVMDLDVLRKERFAEKCMQLTAEKEADLIFPDMDVINAVMLGRMAEIDPAWNMTDRFSFFRRGVKIWHFVCQTQKPWCNLWKNVTWIPYLRYLVKTPYASNAFRLVWEHVKGFFYFRYTKNLVTRHLVCGIRVWRTDMRKVAAADSASGESRRACATATKA